MLQLYNISGGTLGQTNAVVTIINDNFLPGMLSFSTTNFSAQKDSGAATDQRDPHGRQFGSHFDLLCDQQWDGDERAGLQRGHQYSELDQRRRLREDIYRSFDQ